MQVDIMDTPNDVRSTPSGGRHSRAISEAFSNTVTVNLTEKINGVQRHNRQQNHTQRLFSGFLVDLASGVVKIIVVKQNATQQSKIHKRHVTSTTRGE